MRTWRNGRRTGLKIRFPKGSEGSTPSVRTILSQPAGSAAFELRAETDLAALADRLEVGDLVDLAVDRDGGLLFQVLAEAGLAPVHFLDHIAQGLGLARELPHAAGVFPAEAARQDDACGSNGHRVTLRGRWQGRRPPWAATSAARSSGGRSRSRSHWR